jgi:hypothetical protein
MSIWQNEAGERQMENGGCNTAASVFYSASKNIPTVLFSCRIPPSLEGTSVQLDMFGRHAF